MSPMSIDDEPRATNGSAGGENATVLVFGPSTPGDDALKRTRWMADCTVEVLGTDRIGVVSLLDARATRVELEEASDGVSGLALLSHGRRADFHGRPGADGRPRVVDDAIIGADGNPALDRDNLHVSRGRWVHAIACHAGGELGAHVVHGGAVCFVGYNNCALIVDWDPDEIPAPVKPLMRDLVTITTRNLARGVRDQKTLRSEVNEIVEEILDWCNQNRDLADGHGLEVTAQQLVSRLCYFPGKTIDSP